MEEFAVEKRRLQELGGSLFISLPQEWVKTLQLKKGSELVLETGQNNQLCLSPVKAVRTLRKTRTLVFGKYLHRELIAEYLFGTEIIVVEKKDSFSKAERQQVFNYTNYLMNVEIVEETATKITIQHFHTEDAPLKMLIQRMFFLTHTMLLDLSAAKTKEEIDSILQRDMTVGKIYLNIIMHLRSFLTGRLLTKEYSLIDILDLRLLIKQIELIGDEIKGLAHAVLEGQKYKREDINFLADKYSEAFKSYVEKNVVVAQTFWDSEKRDKERLRHNEYLVRIYMHIKDISDLVI
ncbi:AbrB/MazE/SpoVT family DNA-binding domain-containing protein [Candidatus Woesearchaeota archaeon]|nr:AbrB/MazE/SpoVT family DNA-binding domain-containing protein [Candidatus Woesearchaeota archaeon]